MKKFLIGFVIATLVSFSFKPTGGVEGKLFPAIECENYNGKKVIIPADTKGKYTLLGMAFSNDAENDLKTWISPIYNKFIVKKEESQKDDPFDVTMEYDIHLYFIPMFTGLNKLTSKQSKEKIKSHTDKELYNYLLFYEGEKNYKEELNFDKKELPYFFVLDKSGKIVYATSGKYDDKKMEKIIDILEEN